MGKPFNLSIDGASMAGPILTLGELIVFLHTCAIDEGLDWSLVVKASL
jgi:hypothetical protein